MNIIRTSAAALAAAALTLTAAASSATAAADTTVVQQDSTPDLRTVWPQAPAAAQTAGDLESVTYRVTATRLIVTYRFPIGDFAATVGALDGNGGRLYSGPQTHGKVAIQKSVTKAATICGQSSAVTSPDGVVQRIALKCLAPLGDTLSGYLELLDPATFLTVAYDPMADYTAPLPIH